MFENAQADAATDPAGTRQGARSKLKTWSIDRPATLCLLIGGLLLPNMLAIVGGLWIGVPTRSSAIAAYAAVALLCSIVPRLLIAPLFIAALAIDALGIVAHIFFLDLSLIGQNIPAFNHVKILVLQLHFLT